MTTNIHKIDTLRLSFQHDLYPRQIPSWRGAFIEMAGWEADLLHNHQAGEAPNKYQYRYPLVQYRTYQGNASIFAVNEGIEAVQQVLFSKKWEINWKGKPKGLILDQEPKRESHLLQFGAKHRYELHHYLALNAENAQLWHDASSLIERVELLERVLRGHLLSCLWGLGWKGTKQVEVVLQEIRGSRLLPFHGQQLLAFNLIFDTNVDVPVGLGLGKAPSFGFGVLFDAISNKKKIETKTQLQALQDILDQI
jgi:hypothetical protein